jgi:6-pyruvoyl-tetrahydropterin synthase
MRNVKLFVDNLTVIDCSTLHPEHGVDGESWICDIELMGALDDQSMVMDFGHVKKRIKQAIDGLCDHCLLVPVDSACLIIRERNDGDVSLTWRTLDGLITTIKSPLAAICELPGEVVTMAVVERFLEAKLMDVVPATVERITVRLREEVINTPFYHYSHGLKKHDGNCQRIAHGHRSKLEIWRDGAPAPDLVADWCRNWQHRYIGSQEDIVDYLTREATDYLLFAYDAPQGEFRLEIPASRCIVIPTDSTVECIAAYIAAALKKDYPASRFVVKAFEGVGKGAIAES